MKAGFVEIIQMADIGFEVQGSGLATSRNYIKVNREVVKAALKAYVEAWNDWNGWNVFSII